MWKNVGITSRPMRNNPVEGPFRGLNFPFSVFVCVSMLVIRYFFGFMKMMRTLGIFPNACLVLHSVLNTDIEAWNKFGCLFKTTNSWRWPRDFIQLFGTQGLKFATLWTTFVERTATFAGYDGKLEKKRERKAASHKIWELS